MKVFGDVLKRNRSAVLVWFVVSVMNCCVFLLYRILWEPAFYSAAVGFFFLAVFLAVEYMKEKKRSAERGFVIASKVSDTENLPEAENLAETDYQQMIAILRAELESLKTVFDEERQDAADYYTAWVHQIKTPIAVMKFKLSEDSPENRALSAELFRIEQYVDMVLQYIRLGSDTNDLVIAECSVDELVRETVRKFAPQFIEKKLRLDYTPTEKVLVTDRKWFVCILDQLISNAVKYTPSGTVSISVEDDRLIISDTGIGIAKEDIPRIFEKGYTGNNGRIGQKSSGLGLYLAGKAAYMLSLKIDVQSTAGKGSTFSIDLRQE